MWRVLWLVETLNELAEIWLSADADARKSITSATHAIDHELQSDPFRQSESRDDETRVMFAYPLGVQFEVDPDQPIVWVLHVWRYQRRK